MCSSYIFKMTFSTKAMQIPRKKGEKHRRQSVEDGEKLLAVKEAKNYGDSNEKDQNHAPENFTGKAGIGQKLCQFQKNHLLSGSGK